MMTASPSAALPFPPAVGVLGPVYVHFFVVGWVTYGLLNLGLLLRAGAEPLQALQPAPGWGWWLVLSAVLQWLAGVAFVLNTWGRVKEQ